MTEYPYDVAGSVEVEGLPDRGIDLLRRTFRCTNPRWRSLLSLGGDASSEPEFVEYLRETPDGRTRFPRGGLALAANALGREGMSLALRRDLRTDGEARAQTKDVPMRDYQRRAVEEILREEQGVVVLPPGCGKTRLGVGLVGLVGLSALVMVPTIELVTQWSEQVEHLLEETPSKMSDEPDDEAASGGRRVVVATEAGLHRKLVRDPSWALQFGLFVIDEAHRVASRRIQECADLVPARRRCLLTATPDRDDGQGPVVGWTGGRRVVERTVQDMVREGHLSPVTAELSETYYLGVERPPGLATSKYVRRLEADLVACRPRNERVVARAKRDAEAGHSVLVLTGRKEHVRTLVSMLLDAGVRAEGLTSSSAWRKREKVVADFKSGALRVLVATSLADQGLDVARLSRVLLAFPYRSRTMTAQRSGRVMRVFEGKVAVVVDFVDCNVPMLDGRAKERRRLYRKLGISVEEGW